MPEAVRVLAAGACGEQVLSREAEQARIDHRLVVVAEQLAECRADEMLAGDRRAREHRPFLCGQAVEPRCDERVDRRRDGVRRPALREHCGHLFEVERVALSGVRDALPRGRVERPLLCDLVEQQARLVLGQRLQHHPAARVRQPARPLVEQIGAREAEEQHGGAVNPAGEVLEQVEERRLGPVDVLDEDDERPAATELLEEAAHGPERLPARGGVCADCSEHARRHELAVLGVAHQLAHAVVATKRADHLDERPERDPVAVGEAAAGQNRRVVAQGCAELRRQARLADACRPDDGEQATRICLDGPFVRVAQQLQLVLATDQRRVEAPRVRARAFDHGKHVPRGVRIALALESEVVAGLQHDGVLDEAARRLPEQDLSRARGLLQPLGHVDRVAGREHLAAAPVARDDLAGVDADADADPLAQVALQLLVQLRKRQTQLGRGAHGAQRVVFVQLGDAEDGHDRVADELFDGAAVPFEDGRHPLEEVRHHTPQSGVESATSAKRTVTVRRLTAMSGV